MRTSLPIASTFLALVPAVPDSRAVAQDEPPCDWRAGAALGFLDTRGHPVLEADEQVLELSFGKFVHPYFLLSGNATTTVHRTGEREVTLPSGREITLWGRTLELTAEARGYACRTGPFRPYLGGGFGVSFVSWFENENGSVSDIGDSEGDAVGVGRLRLGFESPITETISLDVGLMGERTTEVEVRGRDDELRSLGGYAGLAIRF